MTVKIDKYRITKNVDAFCSSKKSRGIINYKTYTTIVHIDTGNEEVNQKLAEFMLKELNTGKYEDLEE